MTYSGLKYNSFISRITVLGQVVPGLVEGEGRRLQNVDAECNQRIKNPSDSVICSFQHCRCGFYIVFDGFRISRIESLFQNGIGLNAVLQKYSLVGLFVSLFYVAYNQAVDEGCLWGQKITIGILVAVAGIYFVVILNNLLLVWISPPI